MQALTHSPTLLASVKRLVNDKTLLEFGYDSVNTKRPFFFSSKNQELLCSVSSRGVVWKHTRSGQAIKVGRLSLKSDYIITKG